jgi:hypothetical protein
LAALRWFAIRLRAYLIDSTDSAALRMFKDLPVHLRNDFVGVIVAFFSALQITTWCWGH